MHRAAMCPAPWRVWNNGGMNLILPPGVPEKRFHKALDEFTRVGGRDRFGGAPRDRQHASADPH